jgi:DNA-binding NtrC family response regulator
LVLHCKQQDSENFPAASAATPPSTLPSSLKSATEQFEENLIKQAYQTTGSIIKAAKMLGINPSTIHRKLKKGILRIR